MDMTNRIAAGLERGVCLAALAGLLGLAAWRALMSDSFFPDSRYNRGVALRSALPQATHFLETSANFLYFEPYPTPRAENWHRGLSIIALKYWARVVGAGSERMLHVPFVLWVAAWIALAARLTRQLAEGRTSALAYPLLVLLMTASPWAFNLLSRAYLDDVPSAVFVLAGVFWISAKPWGWGHAALGGALLALAYAAKDFAILWLPIGLCAYGVLYVSDPSRPRAAAFAATLAAFLAGYGLASAPKIVWDIHDLGGWLANPIQYWMKAWYFGSRTGCLDCFKPFFLFDDASYRSIWTLSGGTGGVVRNLATRSIPDALRALVSLGFAWWWIAPRIREAWVCKEARPRVYAEAALLVALPAYACFFGLALGEGIQFRYWVAPVTLALAVGVASLERQRRNGSPTWRGWIALAGFAAVAIALQANPASGDILERAYRRAPLPIGLVQSLSASVSQDCSVMLPTTEGFYFWGERPECNVAIFWPPCLKGLDDAQAQRLFDLYRVQWVCFHNDDALRDLLLRWGFRDRDRSEPGFLVMTREVTN